MYYPAPLKSGTITTSTEAFPCLNMIGLGFNNTGESIAKVHGRTVKAGSSFAVNGDVPISQESISIEFEGEGKNELEYTAQIIPANLICRAHE